LQYFPGFFSESQISAQKQDTRAILLKTALVLVSCIQNTQIRGETIAKSVWENRYVLDVSILQVPITKAKTYEIKANH
jgi:hypothetical protein